MEDQKKVLRSTPYPVMTLEDAAGRLKQLHDSMGLGGEYKRETVASGIGYSTITGTSARAVAALVQYGLLTRDKDNYSISELGQRYLVPNTDNDVPSAMREAALSPRLFKQVFKEFEGQVLPKLIANILVTKYGVQSKVAPSVVKLFLSTVTYAGLIAENGILREVGTSPASLGEEPANAHESGEGFVESGLQNSTAAPAFIKSHGNALDETTLNEQGANHSGNGWSLSVMLRTSHRLNRDTRVKIRTLLEAADELADDLYLIDEKDSDG